MRFIPLIQFTPGNTEAVQVVRGGPTLKILPLCIDCHKAIYRDELHVRSEELVPNKELMTAQNPVLFIITSVDHFRRRASVSLD